MSGLKERRKREKSQNPRRPMTVKLIIERLPDWSYGAFLNETDPSCIAIGFTEEDARINGQAALARRRSASTVYGELARPSND